MYQELPTERRDRFYWGDVSRAWWPVMLVGQLLWPLGGLLVAFGASIEVWAPVFLIALIFLGGLPDAWRERREAPRLELWPPRGMFVWQPRGASVGCSIESLIVAPRDSGWGIELASKIPEHPADQDPPRIRVLLATVGDESAAVAEAHRWAERLKLSTFEIDRRTAAQALQIEAIASCLDPKSCGGVLDIPEDRFNVLIGAVVFFGGHVAAATWAREHALAGDPRITGLSILAAGVLMLGDRIRRRRQVVERLQLDLRQRATRRWSGRGGAANRPDDLSPLSDRARIALAPCGRGYGALLDVGDGRWFGFGSTPEIADARQAMHAWATTLDLPTIDLTLPRDDADREVHATGPRASEGG